MDSSRTLILECADNRVSLAVFSRRGSRLCLHSFATAPLAPCGSLEGEALWLAQVRAGFRSLAAGCKLRGPVLLVLPAHLTLIKAIKIPRVAAPQRTKLIAFEAAQAIPYALTDVVWDQVVVGENATESDVLLATARKEVLDSLWTAASDAGLAPRVILPAPFATVAGFKFIQVEGKGAFLGLNSGAHSTTLVLVDAGAFALRTFGLNLDPGGGGSAAAGDATVAVLEPVRARLLQEITRSLLHFQSRSNLAKPQQVYLTGEGISLAGFIEVLRTKLPASVDVVELFHRIDFASDSVARAVEAQSLTFIDLIGAAATQLFRDQAVVNLLPARVHQQVSHRRRRPWLAATALLVMGVLLPPLLHFRQMQAETLKKSAAIGRELAPLRVRAAANKATLQRVEELRQRIDAIERVQERRTSWLRLLVSLQVNLDEVGDVWLEKIQLAPTPAAASLRLLISGRMLDRAQPLAKVGTATFDRVKVLLARFEASPFIAAVEVERFDNQQPGILRFDFVLVTKESRPL